MQRTKALLLIVLSQFLGFILDDVHQVKLIACSSISTLMRLRLGLLVLQIEQKPAVVGNECTYCQADHQLQKMVDESPHGMAGARH